MNPQDLLDLWTAISEKIHLVPGVTVARVPTTNASWAFDVKFDGVREPVNSLSSDVRHRSAALLLVDAIEKADLGAFERRVGYNMYVWSEYRTVVGLAHERECVALLDTVRKVIHGIK